MKWVLRIVAAVAAILVAGALCLWFLSSRPDADRMQGSYVIHRPPAEVWPWLYEADKMTQWVSWMKDVKREAGPLQVGQTAVWTMEDANNGGQQMKITTTVEAVDPNRRYAIKLSAPGGFSGTSEYRLVDLGGSTRIEGDARFHFDMAMARFFEPLIIRQAKKKAAMDMEHLRTLVEK